MKPGPCCVFWVSGAGSLVPALFSGHWRGTYRPFCDSWSVEWEARSLLCSLVTGAGHLVPAEFSWDAGVGSLVLAMFSGHTGMGSLSLVSIDPPQWEACSHTANFLPNKQTALFFGEGSFHYDLRLIN